MADDDQPRACPVCAKHSKAEAAQAEGLVLAGITAYLNGDGDTIDMIYGQLQPYDGHAAITMYAQLLMEVSHLFGIDIDGYLEKCREAVNAKIAATSA